MEYQVEHWLNEDMPKYAEYWNNENEEKKKSWYIVDGNFEKMEQYLKECQLPYDLLLFSSYMRGTGIDLAAGNLWAASYITPIVDKLYCLEYSKHRLLKLGPLVLKHYNVPVDKISLIYGSFYDLHIADNSLDFVFMSQSFHHADNPDKLLSEIYRVLKPDGVVIIIGEHKVQWLKEAIKMIIGWENKVNELGDRHYTYNQYRYIFERNNFEILEHNQRKVFRSFVLNKKGASISQPPLE